MRKPLRNIGASVRARLQNISRERKQTFQQVLTLYVLERLLYRLSQTKYRDRFALKGAMLASVTCRHQRSKPQHRRYCGNCGDMFKTNHVN